MQQKNPFPFDRKANVIIGSFFLYRYSSYFLRENR